MKESRKTVIFVSLKLLYRLGFITYKQYMKHLSIAATSKLYIYSVQ